jgi:hypothetical protein
MFDHSYGHIQQREDRLNFSRKQTFMHDTLIKEKEGYLGLHPRILTYPRRK